MASIVGWLDQSEEQQRKMREVIALFAESGTQDDIGIGVVRDAFSDLLFPGLSTVQTRVRYYLFVPWVFQRLEAERMSSSRAEARSREWEIQIINALFAGGAAAGVIGREARGKLKQLPSYIYWGGLRSFGIRTFKGSRTDLFRSMDRINRTGQTHRAIGDDPIAAERGRWHANLPEPPDDLWESTTLDLTEEEAHYLQERIVASHPDTLLAYLVRAPQPIDTDVRLPWDAVDLGEVPDMLAAKVTTARYFSEVIHGASLLYNLMLSEACVERQLPSADARVESYADELEQWAQMIAARRPVHDQISLNDFWSLVFSSGANVSPHARRFVSHWLQQVAAGVDVANSGELRQAVRTRERQLKKSLARLTNPRALENWGGAAGAQQLEYRWTEGRAAVNDIAAGLGVG
jgi:hypothetical protein